MGGTEFAEHQDNVVYDILIEVNPGLIPYCAMDPPTLFI